MIRRLQYEMSIYPFSKYIREHYKWYKPLDSLHEWSEEEFPLLNGKERDQSSPIHKHFYSIFDANPEFLRTYHVFVSKVVQPYYDEDIVYQARPTFRIHYPGNLAVGEWHKDSDYNHPRREDNWWVPFTKAFDTNTIWVESAEDKEDYLPYNIDPGEVLIFPGSQLKHGNKLNETGVSRVSMDFRVLRMKDYEASEEGSSAVGLKFKVGGYYSSLVVS